MTTDPTSIRTAIACLAAASHALEPLTRSAAISPDGRDRIRQIIGRLALERDILQGGDDRGLVAGALTDQQRAAFFFETFPRALPRASTTTTSTTSTPAGRDGGGQ